MISSYVLPRSQPDPVRALARRVALDVFVVDTDYDDESESESEHRHHLQSHRFSLRKSYFETMARLGLWNHTLCRRIYTECRSSLHARTGCSSDLSVPTFWWIRPIE